MHGACRDTTAVLFRFRVQNAVKVFDAAVADARLVTFDKISDSDAKQINRAQATG